MEPEDRPTPSSVINGNLKGSEFSDVVQTNAHKQRVVAEGQPIKLDGTSVDRELAQIFPKRGFQPRKLHMAFLQLIIRYCLTHLGIKRAAINLSGSQGIEEGMSRHGNLLVLGGRHWSCPGLVDTQLSLSKMGGGVFSAEIETKSWQATDVHA